jgi:hypothetical protein
MLLALASVVFLGSESLETRDHILLSQIWDFHFRDLLRLAGSRWRHPEAEAEAYCRQPAGTLTPGIGPRWDPWPYICSMSRPLFFVFFPLVYPPYWQRRGWCFLYIDWCSLTTPYSTWGYILFFSSQGLSRIYIFNTLLTKYNLTFNSNIHRDLCQCRMVQQPMP